MIKLLNQVENYREYNPSGYVMINVDHDVDWGNEIKAGCGGSAFGNQSGAVGGGQIDISALIVAPNKIPKLFSADILYKELKLL